MNPPEYITVNGRTYQVESVGYRSDGRTDYRLRRDPPPGPRTVPAPESPSAILHWEVTRLDREPLEDR